MTKQFTPGFVWESGMVVTPSRLNRAIEEAVREAGTLTTAMIGNGQVTAAKLAAALSNDLTNIVLLNPPYDRVVDTSAEGGWTELDLSAEASAGGVTSPSAAILMLRARTETGSSTSPRARLFVNHAASGDPDTNVFLGVEAQGNNLGSGTSADIFAEAESVVVQRLVDNKLFYWREGNGGGNRSFKIDLLGFLVNP